MSAWDDKPNDYDHALKLVEAKDAEIVRLQIVIKDQRAQLDSLGDRFDAQSDEIARLRATLIDVQRYGKAEIDKLRATLEQITCLRNLTRSP